MRGGSGCLRALLIASLDFASQRSRPSSAPGSLRSDSVPGLFSLPEPTISFPCLPGSVAVRALIRKAQPRLGFRRRPSLPPARPSVPFGSVSRRESRAGRGCATMWKRLGRPVLASCSTTAGSSSIKIFTAGLMKHAVPPDYSGVTLPEKPKLKYVDRAPSIPKVRREFKNLRDIRGPSTEATEFTEGQYGILAMGGGYLRWGHFEMIRLTINRKINPRTTFAVWRIPAPYKPVTRKGLGQRMGGGKGAIDHYVTAVKAGRMIVEVGGHIEFGEVERILTQVAKKLPFPAIAVSRQSLQEMRDKEEERRQNNQNPWTFERIITSNMLGMRRYLSPYDLKLKGRYWGKFFLPDRV